MDRTDQFDVGGSARVYCIAINAYAPPAYIASESDRAKSNQQNGMSIVAHGIMKR